MRLLVLDTLSVDVRKALGGFRHVPGVALAIIGLLALGIAGVITLFVPLRSIVLSPLPYPSPDQLVMVGAPVLDLYSSSFPNRRSLDSVFSGITAYRTTQATVSATTSPVRIAVAAVTSEFFVTMGMRPWRGSDFAESPVDAPVAVIGYELWRAQCGEVHDLRECTVVLDGVRLDIVGVAQQGFDYPDGTQAWIPPRAPGSRSRTDWTVIGRLLPDLSVGEAAVRLRVIAANVAPADALFRPRAPLLQPLRVYLLGERRGLLWTLWAVSGLFLLLACTGVVNLLWAHGLRRHHEFTTRSALGASRARLVRQLLTETSVLGAAGVSLGLGISILGTRLLGRVLPAARGGGEAVISSDSVGLLLAVTIAVVLFCGLAPALHVTGAGLDVQPRPGSLRTNAATVRRQRIRAPAVFAGCQLALAMVLLVCTALLLRSLYAKLRLPLGFEPQDVAVVQVDVPPLDELLEAERDLFERSRSNQKPGGAVLVRDDAVHRNQVGAALAKLAARNEAWYAEAVDSLAAVPGVTAVGVIFPPPFAKGGNRISAILRFDARTGKFREDYTRGLVRFASAATFRVLGIPLVAGRTFLAQEARPPSRIRSLMGESVDGGDAAIVNVTLARRLWQTDSPLGKELFYLTRRTVVGVVSDIHESSDNLEVVPTVYLPFASLDPTWSFAVKLRSGSPFAPFSAAMKTKLEKLIPGVPPPTAVRLHDLIAEPLRNLRLAVALLACFAVLGTTVAGLGVYATAAEVAASRTREMGVRVALGATAGQIRGLAIWRSLRIALVALPVGVLGSWAVARSLSHWLFQVEAFDPMSFLVCAAVLLTVTFVAGLPSAYRTAAVDPATALRCDG